MTEQELIDHARKDAEAMAEFARKIYEDEYKPGNKLTVTPQAFICSGKGLALMVGPHIINEAFSSADKRHAFAQSVASVVGRYGVTHAVLIAEACLANFDEEQAKRAERIAEEHPNLHDRAAAVGVQTQDVIFVTLYLPGPHALFGQAKIANGHAEPFQWMPGSMDVSGGFVPKDAQRAN